MGHAAGLDGSQFSNWYKFKGGMVARWDVAPNIRASAEPPRPFPLLPYLMRSFFALIFCGLSLQVGGLTALSVDDDKTVAVNAMLAGLILTAASAPALMVASRRR